VFQRVVEHDEVELAFGLFERLDLQLGVRTQAPVAGPERIDAQHVDRTGAQYRERHHPRTGTHVEHTPGPRPGRACDRLEDDRERAGAPIAEDSLQGARRRRVPHDRRRHRTDRGAGAVHGLGRLVTGGQGGGAAGSTLGGGLAHRAGAYRPGVGKGLV